MICESSIINKCKYDEHNDGGEDEKSRIKMIIMLMIMTRMMKMVVEIDIMIKRLLEYI